MYFKSVNISQIFHKRSLFMQNASDLKTQLQAIHRAKVILLTNPWKAAISSGISFFILTMYRGILLRHLPISVSGSVTKLQAFQPLIIKIRLRVWHLQIIWPVSSKLRSAATLSVQKVRAKAVSFPSATADRKCFHVPPAKLRTKKSPRDFYWIPGKRAYH